VAQPPALAPVARTTIQPALDTTPNPTLPPTPAAIILDKAKRAFAEGRYDSAADTYADYINNTAPRGDGERQQALFNWGLSYVLQGSPDWLRAATAFKKLGEEFPNSPLKAEASLIQSLHSKAQSLQADNQSLQSALDQATAESKKSDSKIKQLSNELERLKKIDAGRRKQR
jgi:TolA-binding protein